MEDWVLTEQEKRLLFKIARDTIDCALKKQSFTYPNPLPDFLKKPSGAFVTLKMDGDLRGCIGFTQAVKPLDETIHEMAHAAAFEDPRFAPLTRDEFKVVEIEISIITPMIRVKDVKEIEVGKHGLMIRKGYMSGLLLPQVATEYHWNREQFLENTCYKAGLSPADWKDAHTEIYRFSAIILEES